MTLSVVARCADSGMLGVAAVTASPGVGQLVAWAQAGVGAVATQSWTNPYAATHTGSGCEGYAGHLAGEGFTVQGNLPAPDPAGHPRPAGRRRP